MRHAELDFFTTKNPEAPFLFLREFRMFKLDQQVEQSKEALLPKQTRFELVFRTLLFASQVFKASQEGVDHFALSVLIVYQGKQGETIVLSAVFLHFGAVESNRESLPRRPICPPLAQEITFSGKADDVRVE